MRKFDWLDTDLRTHVEGMLQSQMPRGRGELAYRTVPMGMRRSEVQGRHHVVFVAYYPYPHAIKKSIALRRTGRYFTTFIACCIREDVEILRWFDQAFEIEHYSELFDLLETACPAAISVQIQPSALGAVVLEAAGDARVVADVNDSSFFMEQDRESAACRLERAVLQRACAFSHKMPPEAVKEIRAAWGTRTPDCEVHSLPVRELFTEGSSEFASPYRLLYAGGVMPYAIARSQGHGNHVFDPLIRQTAAQGIELTIMANQNARDMHWEEHDRYMAMQEEHPGFRFQKGVPFHKLPEAVRNFHFGLLYDNLEESSYREELYRYNVSTKIFSYLEAGLPILIHDHFTHMAEIVERCGIGLVYELDRISQLRERIQGCDYAAMKKNVHRFRDEHELAGVLPDLETLYGTDHDH